MADVPFTNAELVIYQGEDEARQGQLTAVSGDERDGEVTCRFEDGAVLRVAAADLVRNVPA